MIVFLHESRALILYKLPHMSYSGKILFDLEKENVCYQFLILVRIKNNLTILLFSFLFQTIVSVTAIPLKEIFH